MYNTIHFIIINYINKLLKLANIFTPSGKDIILATSSTRKKSEEPKRNAIAEI
jgi:hypothetical protein